MIKNEDLVKSDVNSLWHPLVQHKQLEQNPLKQFEKGAGSHIVDEKGQAYLDGVSGLWCVNVGYGRTELAETAMKQMTELAYLPATMSHKETVLLAEKLLDLLGYEGKVFFSNSGSEANEVAFKIARQYHAQKEGHQGRYKIISRYRGYHGNTMGALSATAQAERKIKYEPLVPGFSHIQPPYHYRCTCGKEVKECGLDCANILETTILQEGKESVAAVIMEPIIAGGGVIVPPDGYLQRVREICDQYGVLLIFDEVVNGFARTGKMFGHQHWGVEPDIITFAKGLSSGYMPISATAVKQHVFEAFLDDPGTYSHFRHISTYGGHPVATAVARHNIRIIEEEQLADRAAEIGAYLLEKLKQLLAYPIVGDVRGKGMLLGIELVEDKSTKTPLNAQICAQIVKQCLDEHVIIGRNANTVPGFANILILAPPLVLTYEEADYLAETLKKAIEAHSL